MTLSDLFAYDLPPEMIAQEPIEPRDSSRLFVMEPGRESPVDDRFFNLSNYLRRGDCLVFNDSRVIPARLEGRKEPTGASLEVLLLTEEEHDHWTALIKPSKRVRPGIFITFQPEKFWAYVDGKIAPGEWIIKLESTSTVWESLEELGRVPLPPYIKKELCDPGCYQTVYADERGSAAAPTAGLHFTEGLIRTIRAKGVDMVPVTLHIGLDTFRPIRSERVEEHDIHSERYEITADSAVRMNEAMKNGGRIIAVGTTVIRALESAASKKSGIKPVKGLTDLFITPGYEFKIVEALITNFHLPRSTLLVMVSAFATRERILHAYETAKALQYRFYSFGDAMLIFR